MKTTVEKLNPTRVKLNIAITPEEFKPSLDEAYKHVAKEVNIPGFRKGKVPAPIIDQRVGRGYVIEHAVNDHLDSYYQSALKENDLKPLGRPEAEIVELPDPRTLEGDLIVNVEVDVRPEITVPDLSAVTVEVDPVSVTKKAVDEELDDLRGRFGTLVTVDRPAKTGDFTSLDLTAMVGDETVDTASNISYEIGSGQLLEGIDEVLDTLTAGETTTFTSKLVGGEHEGEDAEITVTLNAVKERELPKADDDFAQLASEFDTIDELRANLKEEVAKRGAYQQFVQARDKAIDAIVEAAEVPIPEHLVDEEVKRHLEQEGKPADDPHGVEVREQAEKTFRQQMLLDVIGEAQAITVSQDELTQYLIQSAMQYGMDPNEFVKLVTENNQVPQLVTEVGRNKSLNYVLSQISVTDTKGKKVDISEFLTPTQTVADEAPAETADAE